ncbi:MAG: FAD/NAD(P)-binding protein [Myxococcota bacterium]|jgi:NAD(P)H-flavin reductase|nr:FAD/NAD(P)-binding protein [Myxococcota bacterium]
MNLYQPFLMRVEEITDETVDTRTLKLAFVDPAVRDAFDFRAGQFGEYSVFGAGECTFCIASPPTRKGYIECSFKKVGKVTAALRQLEVGDTMGFRGPYGNSFPLEKFAGSSLVFIAGGIGLAPVRCVIWNALDLREKFKDITIVYGARSVGDLVYKRELEAWAARPDVKLWQTVDPGGQTPEWRGEVGFVPSIVEKAAPPAQDAYAVICGPPVMIKFTLPVLAKLGFAQDRIYTTLENRMKCGLGKCGRCNIGPVYVCKDGPVFTAAEIEGLPPEF